MRVKRKSDPSSDAYELDLTEDGVRRRIVEPFQKGEVFTCGGWPILQGDVEAVKIAFTYESSQQFKKMIEETYEKYGDKLEKPGELYVFDQGTDVTQQFIKYPPVKAVIPIKARTHIFPIPEITGIKGETRQLDAPAKTIPFEVFICYKRDTARDFAEHLKEGLEGRSIHAFVDTKDIPTLSRWTEKYRDAMNRAIHESKTFLLIMTESFQSSPEIKRELALAKESPDKKFMYFRHKNLSPQIEIDLGDNNKVDIGEREQVSFGTLEDLLREALKELRKGEKEPVGLGNELDVRTDKEFRDAISSIGAFYDTPSVFAAKAVEKVYPRLFTKEELKSMSKADRICRILETYRGNKAQLKQALQTIINLHREHSLRNISTVRHVVAPLGFTLDGNLSVSEVDKTATGNSKISVDLSARNAVNLLKSFDDRLEGVRQATERETKILMLEQLRDELHRFTYDSIPWDNETRDRIMQVLNLVSQGVPNTEYAERYLDYLALILHKNDEKITKIVRERFLSLIESLYEETRFESNPDIPYILLRLHQDREALILKLVDDAIHRWSKQRFDTLSPSLEIGDLRKTDHVYDVLRKHLVAEMNEAEKNGDEEARRRAKKLHSNLNQ